MEKITQSLHKSYEDGKDLVANNKIAQVGLALGALLTIRSLYLTYGDPKKLSKSQPERQYQKVCLFAINIFLFWVNNLIFIIVDIKKTTWYEIW